MKCLEFKRLALSEPNSVDISFVEHSQDCVDCLTYVSGVRVMDNDLAESLAVAIPDDLVARLQLSQEMLEAKPLRGVRSRYAIAASVAVILFVSGFVLSNQFSLNNQIGEDYQLLLSGVAEHMDDHPFTPVWGNGRANQSVKSVLASYDDSLRFKTMKNLTFGRLCPMGKYRGLHAGLQTEDGLVTFAYIKGEPVNELFDTAYNGYVTRVKPLRGGNLIIISKTKKSLEQANHDLSEAMYWDI